jgi:predicted XRE-type DNA-binding protein
MSERKRKGRKLTTGRFDTREQLVEMIVFLWQHTSCRQALIARNCQVSEATVSNIVNQQINNGEMKR